LKEIHPQGGNSYDQIRETFRSERGPGTAMRCTGVADPGNANHALLCQNLLRAANDGYDVSTLIDHGADPMTSGTFCQPSPNP